MKIVATLPKLPQPESTFLVDESIVTKPLYKVHNIHDFVPKNSAELLAAQGNPDEVVKVTLVQDHEHVVGPNTYRYKAYEETTVPRHVAEILEESGLLYSGGVNTSIRQKVQLTKENTRWTVPITR